MFPLPRFASALALFASVLSCASAAPTGSPEPLLLTGARIVAAPGVEPLVGGAVLLKDGRIAAVGPRDRIAAPAGARVIDCSGDTIVAGFWNCHVHFTEPQWTGAASRPQAELQRSLQAMLTRYGFTSVLDLGSDISNTTALRRRIDSGEVPGPRILTAGLPLYPTNGVPFYVTETVPADVVALLPTPKTPEEAVRAVQANVAAGADVVKLFLVTGVRRNGDIALVSMAPEIAKAAAAEAHRLGKIVFVHPSTVEGVRLALAAGVDVLGHTVEDPENWTERTVADLRKAHIALVPTVTLFSRTKAFPGVVREVKSFVQAGGEILFGTDVGFLTDYQDLTREYRLLADGGITPRQLLESLTTAPARRLGAAEHSGRVVAGADGDLVVLKGDPMADVAAFSRVRFTVREGRVVFSEAPEAR
ncbi:4-alpha-glucanotransferase [Opitutaceae bacterium EW11]|nr:4-alpha-glucanotransferase [Opitutaceae bacterium EW11]